MIFRHTLLATALFAGLCFASGRTAAQQVRLLVQSAPLAGFNYHQAPELWQGNAIRPDYDVLAEVEWLTCI